MNPTIIYRTIFLGSLLVAGQACTKLVESPEPVNTITTSETFSSDGNATSAVVGIYSSLTTGYNQNMDFGNGNTTFCAGQAADELTYFPASSDYVQFEDNTIQSTNGLISGTFWAAPYTDIYGANAAIMGLQGNTVVSPALKSQLLGEAYFLRAYCYFYMVNLFGNVPLVTTTAWKETDALPGTPASQIYQQIVSDLRNAEGLMVSDYSMANGQRIRANKWAAAALLARVYLYMGNWTGADSAASAVIGNSGLYSLPGLDSVFLANSQEAIWQLPPNNWSQYATWEGNTNIPYPVNTGNPNYIMTPQLVSAFEPGDQRYVNWVDSTLYSGATYYFPYKYKVQTASATSIPEYYMMLRLGEQYLIRAEADAHGVGGGVGGAVADLNTIRRRAMLPPYTGGTDSASMFTAIVHERRIELFAEKGNRWMDLKRLGLATSVLGTIPYKQPFKPDALLWPLPIGEIQTDPNLIQNPGY